MTKLLEAFERIDAFAKQWMERGNIPGLTVAVTSREQPLKTLCYGFANVASRTPVTEDTLFEIGSLGKPFTSIALLQLRDAGLLDLNKPVSDYLPWFEVPSKFPPINVHHLMNHTSGIIRGTERAFHGLYDVWALRDMEAHSAPGQYFCYSSIGYKALGFLLEELTGQTYREAIESRVLEPLGMAQTHAVTTLDTHALSATGYCGFYDDRPEHPSHAVAPAPWQEFGTGDGCQASNARDMSIYLRMLLNRGQGIKRRVMSEESFDLMTLHGIWTGGDFYGYGLATYKDEDRTYIGHGGGNPGYRSAIVVDMDAGLGVVFLLNRMGETDPVVAAAQHALTLLRCAQRGEALPTAPPVEPAHVLPDVGQFVGTYRGDDGQFQVSEHGGALQFDYQGTAVALEWRGRDRFYVRHPDFALFLMEFKRQDGKPDGRVVEAFHGQKWYTHDRYKGSRTFDCPPEYEAYLGHYRARNTELSNFRIVRRKGALTLIIAWGDSEPLHPLGGSTFRISDDPLWPEKIRFDAVVAGQALRADFSGCPYYRAFTP